MKRTRLNVMIAAACIATAAFSTGALASVTTIPDSALVSSTGYYTDGIGGGIGTPLIMTGSPSASAPNIGGSPNDDGFSGPIDLGFTLSFFGQDYTQFWANNNGNISFNNGISAFNPTGPTGADEPIISPFFADVDTRGANSGLMYLRSDIPNEIIVTWDQVGYYNSQDDKLDSFQLVLRGPGFDIPDGEGPIGFFYKTMQWETTPTSQPTPAAVGFGDGAGNGETLEGSLDYGIAGVVSDHHIWFDQNLAPVPPPSGGTTPPPPVTTVPEPSELPLMLLGLLGLGTLLYFRRRRQPS